MIVFLFNTAYNCCIFLVLKGKFDHRVKILVILGDFLKKIYPNNECAATVSIRGLSFFSEKNLNLE